MTAEKIKDKINGMNEGDAFYALFSVIISQNGYYDNLRDYSEKYDGGLEQMISDVCKTYDYSEITPYAFLDAIEDYLACKERDNMTIAEIVDEIYS